MPESISFLQQHSAFTYWEEQCPSHIDLGKDKYGGPFAVEEVEDVKTALKLVSLISCAMPVFALETANEVEGYVFACGIHDSCFWLNSLWYAFAIFRLPFYQFLVYPFFNNHIPNMLRRIAVSIAELYAVLQTYNKMLNATFTGQRFENEKFLFIP